MRKIAVIICFLAIVICSAVSIVSVSGYTRFDVNCDGKVDIKDVTSLQKYLAGKYDLDAVSRKNADADNNQLLDVRDVSYIQKYLVNKIVESDSTQPTTKDEVIHFPYVPAK